MALGNDENPNNGPQNPFAYVLIPVIGFGLVVSLVTCYRYRRRKQRLAHFAAGGQAQLEAGGRTRLDRGPNSIVIIAAGGGASGRAERRALMAGRSRRLGLGFGTGSREEGLNELGEAPPAYMPNTPKPPTEGAPEGVELTTYSQATAEAGTSRSPPSYGEHSTSSVRPGTGTGTGTGTTSSAGDMVSTDVREDGSENATGATDDLTRPQRAILPSSRHE
ncbi:hypothetical protein F5Y14DRAFT_446829 [Nemania sp. NC0429]|nr:hypothetical protein F5Y14DRAFT_446829 [Nemania sp. NC0429]